MKEPRRFAVAGSLAAIALIPLAAGGAAPARAASSSTHVHIDCEYSRLCPDLADTNAYDHYVGHDEPSLLFYSNKSGSGNRMQYNLTLPKDPSPTNPLTKSYNFETASTFWFGMALCDTQSYPEQVSTCKPDSDTNIKSNLAQHPGAAFLELQFYAPGWVPWPTWQVATGAATCDPTRWCAAMNVFSLLRDPVNGQDQNASCQAKVGLETFEFAFVTKNGVSHAPANPLDATSATYTPDPARDLFMNSGDHLQVSIHDTHDGVRAQIKDLSSEQSGSMTASPANGFAQFQFDPTGTSCNAIPYAFHPMYATSSEQTRVPWAAHSYNVGFSAEIGHFEFCNGPNPVPATPFGLDSSGNPVQCPAGNTEGLGSNTAPTDSDDDFCFPGSEALRIHVQGCTDTNLGFDGASYQPIWPDGNTTLHPTSEQFTSPLFGENYSKSYDRIAFEADLPRIELSTCNRATGAGCSLTPTTDRNQPVAFYPFFTTASVEETCKWQFGNSIPGDTNEFGQVNQYGQLLPLQYLVFGGGGATNIRFNDFRGVIANPCNQNEEEGGE
jgi:hypothetical protein